MKFWHRLISSSIIALSLASCAGKTLVSSSYDGTIKLWDLQTGRELRTLKRHSSGVDSLAFSPDGQTLISSDGYNLKLWRLSGP